MALKNEQKRAQIFYCKFCDYTTSRKNNWDRHLTTLKHKTALNGTKKRASTFALHRCSTCGKKYKHLCSLYRHKKKCEIESQEFNNQQFLEKKCEKLENEISQLKTNTQIINYNNININLFLDNHYRSAMNLTDFVNKIKLSMEDLIYTKNNGYINGVSKILISNLDKLDKTKRPIQYIETDSVFYVKDKNKWGEDKGNIDQGINNINKKQIQTVQSILNSDDSNNDVCVEVVKEITKCNNNHMDNEKIKKNLEKNTSIIIKQ